MGGHDGRFWRELTPHLPHPGFADDDWEKTVFDPEIRVKTDRFVMRLRKPE